MNKTLQVVIAMGFLVGSVSTGIAGQGTKNDPGKAQTPDKIQRSTPSGEKPLPSGSGPGSRSNELTGMEEVESMDPKLSGKKGDAAQAAKELNQKKKGKNISSKSSSKKSHE